MENEFLKLLNGVQVGEVEQLCFLSIHDCDIITSQTVVFLIVFVGRVCPTMHLRVVNVCGSIRHCSAGVQPRSGLFGSGLSCTINQSKIVIIKS